MHIPMQTNLKKKNTTTYRDKQLLGCQPRLHQPHGELEQSQPTKKAPPHYPKSALLNSRQSESVKFALAVADWTPFYTPSLNHKRINNSSYPVHLSNPTKHSQEKRWKIDPNLASENFQKPHPTKHNSIVDFFSQSLRC